MKAKRYFKILSVFLSMLMLISVIPINGAAIEKIDASSDTQNEAETKLASDGEILYEINDKRTQNSKTYKKSDGSYCTYLSSSVLHYFDGEEWRDINNTITPDGNGAYKNVSNSFEIKFPETLKENNSIDVLKDGHAISFVINGGDSDKKADIQNPKETADISSLQDKSDSSVSYKNVLKNTDIQYSVNGNVVKENIIIKSKKAVEKTYSYTVSTDLSIEKNNDGSLIFKDAEGNNVFKIPSPVMYDNDKNSSSKIAVTLEKICSVGSPLGANMYAYCNNNPINKIDYNGLSGTDVVKNVVPGLVSIIIISTVFSDLFMGGYEAIDFKQAINDYGLLIANLAIKKQNANKYKILKVVLGGVEQWKNYCADNENDNLGLTKKEIEYIKNSSYYDLEENYYKNTKPQFEGYEQYEGAFHLSLLLGWYLSMEILNARNNSIKNNTYFFHLRNCDAFIAYKKYNASTKRGYLKIINDFSIPKYKDADGTIGL